MTTAANTNRAMGIDDRDRRRREPIERKIATLVVEEAVVRERLAMLHADIAALRRAL
jgi:hypothetical protein